MSSVVVDDSVKKVQEPTMSTRGETVGTAGGERRSLDLSTQTDDRDVRLNCEEKMKLKKRRREGNYKLNDPALPSCRLSKSVARPNQPYHEVRLEESCGEQGSHRRKRKKRKKTERRGKGGIGLRDSEGSVRK
jgi:hypothetical protein